MNKYLCTPSSERNSFVLLPLQNCSNPTGLSGPFRVAQSCLVEAMSTLSMAQGNHTDFYLSLSLLRGFIVVVFCFLHNMEW